MRWILILLLMCLAGLQYRLWVGPGSWANVASLKRELAEQATIIQNLQRRNSALEKEVHGLKNGLEGIEERARTELGLIKKDETFYLLVDEDK